MASRDDDHHLVLHTQTHHTTWTAPPHRRSNPLCRVALIGVTAGGIGLDLTAASTAIFLELPPQVADLRQAEDRCVRGWDGIG
jgi:hypothetical protein